MSQPTLMNLRILLPFEVFVDKMGISKVIAETSAGSLGFFPIGLTVLPHCIPES